MRLSSQAGPSHALSPASFCSPSPPFPTSRLYKSPRARKKAPNAVSPHDWLKSERAREELANVAEALTVALADGGDAAAADSPLNRSLDSLHLRRLSLDSDAHGRASISPTPSPASHSAGASAAVAAARRRRSSQQLQRQQELGGGSAHSLMSDDSDRPDRWAVPPTEEYVHVPDPNRVRRKKSGDQEVAAALARASARGEGGRRRVLPQPGGSAPRQTLYVDGAPFGRAASHIRAAAHPAYQGHCSSFALSPPVPRL